MAPQRRRASAPARPAAALLALACLRSAFHAFVGSPSAAGSRLSSARVPLRVNIFEGISLPSFGAPEQDPDEIGTRSARQADEATARVVEVNMPLGLEFEERDGGDIYITGVDPSSDAYSQGVREGSQLVMVSATFGDEMWSARKVGMTQFMTVVNSRFGATMRLALEREEEATAAAFLGSQSILSSFMEAAFPPANSEEAKQKEEELASIFEREEARLSEKSMWNPFR